MWLTGSSSHDYPGYDKIIETLSKETADSQIEKSAAFIGNLVADGGMYIRVGACALALSYVASGRLLAAYEPKVSPWDDLAGMLLVREAGGRTNDFAPSLASETKRPVLASTPGLWDAVRGLY